MTQGPLQGWHIVYDAATNLYRLAELKDGVVQRWGSFPASVPAAKATPPKPEPTVQNYGVSLDDLRKQAPVGWSNAKGQPIQAPGDRPQIVAGQQQAWPTVEQARGLDLAAYVAPGIVILAALWLLLHNPKGSR